MYLHRRINEEPVIPEYDYLEVAQIIEDIDAKIAVLKHAINLNNAMAKVPVGDEEMSIDTILVKMAQLNKRKNILDMMRKQLPKERLDNSYRVRNSIAEYRYINYDPALIKQEYERVSDMILLMQMSLDKYNQTVEFEVDF